MTRVWKKKKKESYFEKLAKRQEAYEKKRAQDNEDYLLSLPQPELQSHDPTPLRVTTVVQTTRWQEAPPCESKDFKQLGNSHNELPARVGVSSLRTMSAASLAKQARSLSSSLLKEVPNPLVWKSAWDAVLHAQHDSFNVFLVFAAELQKQTDFSCHYTGLLHPRRELTPRAHVLRAMLLRGKSRHRIESVAQALTVGDISYLELGTKELRFELILNYTRDDLYEHAQNALTRLRNLTVLDLRFIEIGDATLSLWKNAILRGDWPSLKVILVGHANAERVCQLMDDVPQLWYVGYRGDRCTHKDWYTFQHDIIKEDMPDRLSKTIKCALNHPSSWLLSSLKELNDESQRGKLILEVNFAVTSWDLGELRSCPVDYVHCIRTRKSEEKCLKPLVKPEAKPLYRQVARKKRTDIANFFG